MQALPERLGLLRFNDPLIIFKQSIGCGCPEGMGFPLYFLSEANTALSLPPRLRLATKMTP